MLGTEAVVPGGDDRPDMLAPAAGTAQVCVEFSTWVINARHLLGIPSRHTFRPHGRGLGFIVSSTGWHAYDGHSAKRAAKPYGQVLLLFQVLLVPVHFAETHCRNPLEPGAMKLAFEDVLIDVWRQTLVDEVKKVELWGDLYAVGRADNSGLRQVYFVVEGQEVRGIEQNPNANSAWAEMARAGQKVMEFVTADGSLAVVADGKLYNAAPDDHSRA